MNQSIKLLWKKFIYRCIAS